MMKTEEHGQTCTQLLFDFSGRVRSLSVFSLFYVSVALFLGAMMAWGALLYFQVRTERKQERDLGDLKVAQARAGTKRHEMQEQKALLQAFYANRAIAEARSATAILSRLWQEHLMTPESLRTSNAATRMVEGNPSHAPESVAASIPKASSEASILSELLTLRSLEEGIHSGAIHPGLKEQDLARQISDRAEKELQVMLNRKSPSGK